MERSRIRIDDILFGADNRNFVVWVDDAGKKYSIHIDGIPTYTALDQSQPGFDNQVRSDYDYALSQLLAFKSQADLETEYSAKWGMEVGSLVIARKVGLKKMSKDAAFESWGRPDDT